MPNMIRHIITDLRVAPGITVERGDLVFYDQNGEITTDSRCNQVAGIADSKSMNGRVDVEVSRLPTEKDMQELAKGNSESGDEKQKR